MQRWCQDISDVIPITQSVLVDKCAHKCYPYWSIREFTSESTVRSPSDSGNLP